MADAERACNAAQDGAYEQLKPGAQVEFPIRNSDGHDLTCVLPE